MNRPLNPPISFVIHATPSARRARKRRVNWRSKLTPKTIALHQRIAKILVQQERGLIVRELADELGISRQLALYHLKKLAALGGIVMVLEPCAESGGLRFRCWDETALGLRFLEAA